MRLQDGWSGGGLAMAIPQIYADIAHALNMSEGSRDAFETRIEFHALPYGIGIRVAWALSEGHQTVRSGCFQAPWD